MLAPLYPWFFAGLAALAVPVLLHLWRTREPRTSDFPALRFLREAYERRKSSLQIERKRLLALRLLALVLIVLAFARPTIRTRAVELRRTGQQATAVLVLDTSFSMGASDNGIVRFDRALRRAHEVLDALAPGDEAAILLAENPPRALVRRPTPFLRAAAERLRGLAPSFRTADIELALAEARALLRDIQDRRKEIYLISDLQTASWASVQATGRRDGREAINLHVIDVGRPLTPNAAPVGLRTGREAVLPGEAVRLDWLLQAWGGAGRTWADGSYRIGDGPKRRTRAPLDPAARTTASATAEFAQPGYVESSFSLPPDALETDNTFHAVIEVQPPPRVVVLDGGDGGAAPFLVEALRSLPQLGPASCVVVAGEDRGRIGRVSLLGAALVFVVDAERLAPHELDWLGAHIDSGGSVWFMPGPNLDREAFNRDVCERYFNTRLADRVERELGRAAQMYMVDGRHPIFRAFTREPAANFAVLRFQRYWRLEPVGRGDAVLAASGDGDDFLVERRLGNSSLLLSAWSPGPEDTSLPTSPLYVPLLGETISYCDRYRGARTRCRVGQPMEIQIELEQRGEAEFVEIVTPQGQVDRLEIPLERDRLSGRVDYARTEAPGVYTVRLPGIGRARPGRFAVNLDPAESDLRAIPPAEAAGRLADYRVEMVPNDPRGVSRALARAGGIRLDWLVGLAALAACVGELLFAHYGVDRV